VASIQGDPIVEKKIAGIREWKNSGFSVENSVFIEADKGGMLRLLECISNSTHNTCLFLWSAYCVLGFKFGIS
jgi:hypothetical protein